MADRIKEMRTLLRGKLEALTGRGARHMSQQLLQQHRRAHLPAAQTGRTLQTRLACSASPA